MRSEAPKLRPRPRSNGRTVEERAEAIVAVCRAAAAILEGQAEGRDRLLGRDRVPDSTREILRRLARGDG